MSSGGGGGNSGGNRGVDSAGGGGGLQGDGLPGEAAEACPSSMVPKAAHICSEVGAPCRRFRRRRGWMSGR